MAEASLDAEKLAVQPIDITVAGHNGQQIITAGAERHLTAIRAGGAGGNCLRQFPGPSLMTIGGVEECACRARFNAGAALRTIEPGPVGSTNRAGAPAARSNRIS